MATEEKKRIAVMEGLWTTPSSPGEESQLIGSKCRSCGELFFPKKEKGFCLHCQRRDLEDVKLSRRGKINSFTVVMQKPGGGFYFGPVPYAYGGVHLPEGLQLYTLFTQCEFDELKVGMDVEMVIEKLYEDEGGNEVVTYKFKPVKNK